MNSPYVWWHQPSKNHHQASLCRIMQNSNFIVNQFPKQSRWQEYPRENNTRTTKVWENVVQTRLGGEFWACDVITHKTYWDEWAREGSDMSRNAQKVKKQTPMKSPCYASINSKHVTSPRAKPGHLNFWRLDRSNPRSLGPKECLRPRLYGEKLARLGGWPYHRKRVTRLGG